MKKLLTMGITVLVTALLIASCANPFVNEDGETAAVSDLTVSSITHNSAEVSWVEPEEGLYSDVQIVVSTTDAEDLVLQQAKSEDGNGSVALTELAAETDYTVAVSLVASNGAITPESVSEEFTTSAAPEEEVATTFTVSTITITGMAAYNGDEVALTGSANWLDDFQGWDSPYKETVSDGEVTFTLDVELDPAIFADYQWKAITDDTWTTVTPLHDDLGGFDNANLSALDGLDLLIGNSYDLSVDNVEGAADFTKN